MNAEVVDVTDRNSGLGASDAAPAVGLSPWKTPLALYLEKLGQLPPRPLEEEHQEALRLTMGKALEPVALAQFCRRSRLQVSGHQRQVIDPNWPRRWVTVDALSSDGGLVEAKSTGFAAPDEWGDELEDGAIPMHYLLQVQHGLACTGLPHAWVPLIISNRSFRLYRVKRDPELIELLTQREQEFWARIEARDPPAPANLEDVKLRWPSHEMKRVHATAEVAHALAEHRAVKERIKAAEIEKNNLELLVKQHMGDAAELIDVSDSVLCTWKQAKPSQLFNEDRFALEHPELYRQYLIERPGSRRFMNKL